jgi:hypothetical protein
MTTADESEDEHALYLRWLEKRDAARAAAEQERRTRADKVHHDTEAGLALILGRAADDGAGRCKWCGITLGHDAEGRATHPVVRECPGPRPDACGICHRPYVWSAAALEWSHDCPGRGPTRSHVPEQLERVRPAVRAGAPPEDRGAFGYRRGGDE